MVDVVELAALPLTASVDAFETLGGGQRQWADSVRVQSERVRGWLVVWLAVDVGVGAEEAVDGGVYEERRRMTMYEGGRGGPRSPLVVGGDGDLSLWARTMPLMVGDSRLVSFVTGVSGVMITVGRRRGDK